MSDFNYLVALALIEQNGNRLMPIGGKSLKEPFQEIDSPTNKIENIALEIFLRLMVFLQHPQRKF